MLKALKNKKDLRKRILITTTVLLVIQILAGIPTPGVKLDYFKELINSNTGIGMLNMFTGNGLGNLSITMLSITPYITASIILQLMGVVFPTLQEIQKDGETGQKLFRKYTIVLGVALAAIESVGFAIGFGKQGLLISYKWYWVLCVSVIWVLMAFLMMLAGELIERKGFGNGISLILVCNILSSYPSDIYTLYEKFIKNQTVGNTVLHTSIIVAFILVLFVFTIIVQETEKRILVQYSTKLQGNVVANRQFFPIKLCPGSVVPIIFASSLMSMPTIIATLFGAEDKYWIINMLNSGKWFNVDNLSYSVGVIIYIIMIVGFSYFYTGLILSPLDIATNFKKSGGVIPGIRPGKPTADYFKGQIKWVVGIGAVALCMIALVPCVLAGVFGLSKLSFTGTSIIITVGVLIETKDRFLSEIQTEMNRRKISLF